MDMIPVSEPFLGERERQYLLDAFDSGWISSAGPYIERLERAFASFCGVTHAVAVSNGTVALHLALHALGIAEGDEVIVPDLTFVATGNVVLHAHAVPVIVDVDPETWCMDPAAFERAITDKTRVVIPVHLYGHPADMERINAIARARGVTVIEDAAEAHGAQIGARRVGSFGRCAAFSFYGNKIMTTGEGGMVTTNDAELAERLRFLRDHGMSRSRRYWHTEVGFNYRMTNLQAAIGLAQLEQIDLLIRLRREVVERYRRNLAGVPGLSLNPCRAGVTNTYWMACLRCAGWNEERRAAAMTVLREKGVDTRPFFYPLSAMPMYAGARHDTPTAHLVSPTGINLPSSAKLSPEQVDRVSERVLDVVSAGS